MRKHNTSGFIALTSVLILSAIFLSISISIATRAISGLDTSIVFLERDEARYLAEACVEHALMELQRTLGYEGDEVILIDDASCEIESIGGSGNTNRTIEAHSTVGSHTYRIEVVVSEISPDATITSFQRVAAF